MQNNKTFGFKAQMAIGDKGEKDFLKRYKDLNPVKSEDRAIDFHLSDGKTVELKSDSYPMEKTENMFFETLSDMDSGKIGGVHRAKRDKIDYFVYYYPTNKTFFWFDVDKLHAAVEKLIKSGSYKAKIIRNSRWLTQGYALPRSAFKDIILKEDVFS